MANLKAAPRPNNDDTVDLQAVLDGYDKDQALRGMFRPKSAGEYRVRILPPIEAGLYYESFGLHYNVALLSPLLADEFAMGCYKRTLGQDCPLCVIQARLYTESRQSGDETKAHLAKQLRGTDKFECNIIDLDNEKQGVITWEFPRKVHDKVRAIFVKRGNIAHSITGINLELTYEKKKIEGNEVTTCENVALGGDTGALDDLVKDWRTGRKDLVSYATSRLMDRKKLDPILAEATLDLFGVNRTERRNTRPAREPEAEPDVIPGEGAEAPETAAADDDLTPESTGDPTADEMNDPDIQALLARLRKKK